MPVEITKVGSKYKGRWTDINGNVRWSTDTPMYEDTLVTALTKAGCHLIDVYDELERVAPRLPGKEERDRKFAELVSRGVYPPKQRSSRGKKLKPSWARSFIFRLLRRKGR